MQITNFQSILYFVDNYSNEYYKFKLEEKREEIIDFLAHTPECKKKWPKVSIKSRWCWARVPHNLGWEGDWKEWEEGLPKV